MISHGRWGEKNSDIPLEPLEASYPFLVPLPSSLGLELADRFLICRFPTPEALAVGSLKYGWSFEQMPRIALGYSLVREKLKGNN